jgi:hypothetical protein
MSILSFIFVLKLPGVSLFLRPFELSVLVDPSQYKGSEVGELVTDRIEVNSNFLCEKLRTSGYPP